MASNIHPISSVTPQIITTAELSIQSRRAGFTEITSEAARFLSDIEAGDGVLFLFLRHTSASLLIQENADPAVRTDLATTLNHLAPEGANWTHDAEGPDDMPAHVKSMLTGVSLHIPVVGGAPSLGTWQGIYLMEHRRRPHRRTVILQFLGSRGLNPLKDA